MRKTKIVATLGPATDKPGMLEAIIREGVDVVRINMSHGEPEEHMGRADRMRKVAAELGRTVGVLVDLQGPKIRVLKFKDGGVHLKPGDHFAMDNNVPDGEGDQDQVGLGYKGLPHDVNAGDSLLLDDGRIVMKVEQVVGERVECSVVVGGYLSNNKGINLQGGGLSADAITDKDKADIITAAKIGADFLALSFPRSAEDVDYCRTLALKAGLDAKIVSKLERAEVMDEDVLKNIIKASDVLMVARGDLGVEIGDALLPAAQKKIIQMSRHYNRAVITATQMMESMIENPIPTRAEVFDVANAVIDGTDSVMLSGETAVGKNPDKVIKSMVGICLEAEKQQQDSVVERRTKKQFERSDEAIARSTVYMANNFDLKAIVALTDTSNTALLMSRVMTDIPIFALSKRKSSLQYITVYRGTYPLEMDYADMKPSQIKQAILHRLMEEGYLAEGDQIAMTHGKYNQAANGTNAVEILTVQD